MDVRRAAVALCAVLTACSLKLTVPLPEVGDEVGNITLNSGKTVGSGKVEQVDGTRVLIVHGWDLSETWVEWARVVKVE